MFLFNKLLAMRVYEYNILAGLICSNVIEKFSLQKKITNQNDVTGKHKISILGEIHTQSYYV